MNIATGWVAPVPSVAGQDHLAVQAPCVALYTQLLPGITNVSDRARCYTFYPWLLWAFERRYGAGAEARLPRILRRAECLVTLIVARHAHTLGLTDRTDGEHGPALVWISTEGEWPNEHPRQGASLSRRSWIDGRRRLHPQGGPARSFLPFACRGGVSPGASPCARIRLFTRKIRALDRHFMRWSS